MNKTYVSEAVLLKEEPVSIFSISVIVSIAYFIFTYLLQTVQIYLFKFSTTIDEDLSREIGEIVNDDRVKVRVVRVSEINAFNAGGTDLYMTSGLKKILNREEIKAVLLHEYGHYHGNHMTKQHTYNGFVNTGIAYFILSLNGPTPILYLLSLLLLKDIIGIGDILNTPYKVTVGRLHEYFADNYAKEHGYGPELISAHKKFDKYMRKAVCAGLTKQECSDFINRAHATDEHPTFDKRIEALERFMMAIVKKFGFSRNGLGLLNKIMDQFSLFFNLRISSIG